MWRTFGYEQPNQDLHVVERNFYINSEATQTDCWTKFDNYFQEEMIYSDD